MLSIAAVTAIAGAAFAFAAKPTATPTYTIIPAGFGIVETVENEQDAVRSNPARGAWLCVEVPDEGIYEYLEVDCWKPAEEDVEALCKMAWGEARGCGERGIEAVMWVAMNRLDTGRWGDTVLKVVSARAQFYGYKASNPVTDEIRAIAERVLTAHHNGEEGIIPSDYIYFHGDGRENTFRNERGERVRV